MLELEKSIIGTILLNDEVLEKMINFPNIFVNEKHQIIIDIAKELYNTGIQLSTSAIVEKSKIEKNYIDHLYSLSFQKDLFDYKFNDYLKKYTFQRLEIIQQKYRANLYKTYNEYLIDVDSCNLNYMGIINDTKTLKEIYSEYIQKSEDERYKTGFDLIDNYGGFLKSQIVIIGARPGMGKSSLMVDMIKKDMTNKYKIGLISLEMNATDLIQKKIANATKIDENLIDRKMLTNIEKDKIANYMNSTFEYPIYVNDNPNLDIDSMCRLIKKWHKNYNIDKYYIDYLQFIPCLKNFKTETDRVQYVMQKLTRLKKEINKNIIVLAQLNRESEQGNNSRKPRLSDLKQSGQIEQDADVIIFLYELEIIDTTKSKYEIIIAKGRKLPKGIIECIFYKNFSKFVEGKYER